MYRGYELYARGDPGFFSFIGKALGAVAHVAEFIPGVGSVVKVAETAVNAASSIFGPHQVAMPGAGLQGISLPPTPGIGSVSVGPVAGQYGLINTQVTTGGGLQRVVSAGPGGTVPRGYHMSKPRRGHPSHLVRNRHMNWANGRALSRAERRVGKFVRHATHLIRWVHPHKKGRAVPKIGGRKR